MIRILSLSSSRSGNGGYLETAAPLIRSFTGTDRNKTIAFIPFASVPTDYEAYGDKVREALPDLAANIRVVDPHQPLNVLEQAQVIMTGGGNTFKLLHDLYELDILHLIRAKVRSGTPYIGWSAGANITGRTISTTNDMPIIQPKEFTALQFFPFQINPHYRNEKPEGFHGETRDDRLHEFVLLNPAVPVVALPEGTALVLEQEKLRYEGSVPCWLFRSVDGQPEKQALAAGSNLDFLMETPSPAVPQL